MFIWNDGTELYHHGIKDQKWGVRRFQNLDGTYTEEGKRRRRIDYYSKHAVKKMINSGIVSSSLNVGSQGKHIKGSHNFDPSRGLIYGDMKAAEKLLSELSGTGKALVDPDTGQLTGGGLKERVRSDHIIGIYKNNYTGVEYETMYGIIHYAKTGAHIVPSSDPKKERR